MPITVQWRAVSVAGCELEHDGATSVGPVAFGLELLGEVFHLVRQDPLFGQKMPLISVGSEWHCKKRHVRFFGCLAVFQPIAAFAGRDHVLPFIAAAPGNWHDMIPGQLATAELASAVQTAVIITSKQRAIA